MAKTVAITTVDNPWNPLKDPEKWLVWDITAGYNTCGYLARVARTSDSLTDEENEEELERAIDEIIAIDPFNIYSKVTSEDEVAV